MLLVGWSRGRKTAVDFTLCHPLAPSKWLLQLSVVADALKKTEKKKVLVAQERCTHARWSYVAAAFSPWEIPGPIAAGHPHGTGVA